MRWSARRSAGCARVARLSRTFATPSETAIWETGTSVAGPLIFALVLWVLISAQRRKLARVYFMTRDGEIMYLVAKIICAWLSLDVDCRLLHTSRQALSLPATDTIDADALRWILRWPRVSSVRQILTRVGLSPHAVAQELERAGFRQDALDTALDDGDVARLSAVLSQERVQALILAEAERRRQAVIAYLEQEGLTEGRGSALADVGWQATIQRALADIMRLGGVGPPAAKGFYFGLHRDELFVGNDAAEAFFPSDAHALVWLIEAFCASEQASLDRFELENGTAKPIFRAARDEVHVAWGASLQRDAILAFARELSVTLRAGDIDPEQLLGILKPRVLANLDVFRTDPSAIEAEAYGRLRSSAVPTHDSLLEGAPKLSLDQLVRWTLLRGRSGVPHIVWPEAAIRRSEVPGAFRLGLLWLYHLRNGLDRLRGRGA